MLKMIVKCSAVVWLILITVSCAKETGADFTGYVVLQSNDNITIVEASDRMPPFVYLHSGVTFQVGSKVEVRFKDEAMHTAFPSTGKADLVEISTSVEEKEALAKLLNSISDQHGPDYYTAVISITEQAAGWIIRTQEHEYRNHMESYLVSYHVSGDSLDITIIDKMAIDDR